MDGAEYNTNSEMLIYLWSSTMAMTNWSTKFPIAVVPMRWLPSKQLKEKVNQAIVKLIAWDRSLGEIHMFTFLRIHLRSSYKLLVMHLLNLFVPPASGLINGCAFSSFFLKIR